MRDLFVAGIVAILLLFESGRDRALIGVFFAEIAIL